MNKSVIDASAIEPYTTNVIDGGMTTPIAPPAAISAQENAAGYPAFTNAGIIINPNAATVAGPEPEIAAKKQDTTTQTIAIPPLICPRHFSARLIKRPEIPAFSITLPEMIKNGIANNTNLLLEAEQIRGNTDITATSGFPAPCTKIAATLDIPRQTAIGAPNASRRTNTPSKTIPTISFYSSFVLAVSTATLKNAIIANAAPIGTNNP